MRRDVVLSPPRDGMTLRSCDLALGWSRLRRPREPRWVSEWLRAGLAIAATVAFAVVLMAMAE